MSRFIWRTINVIFFTLIIVPVVVFGQNIDELCQAFANQAFRDLGTNCANLDANEICYGFGNIDNAGDPSDVTLTFYADGENGLIRDDVFTEPSERISLIDLDTMETVESVTTQEFFLDQDNDEEDENRWGVAVQTVPANLPTMLEQNTAYYILFGGSRIENGVMPEDALILPDEPLLRVAVANTAVFGSPVGLGYTVPSTQVGTVEGIIQLDGISPDGNWLRIFYLYERDFGQRATAWIQTADLEDSTGIDVLPEIGPNSYTSMQKLYLTSSFNTPICEEIPPPGLLVQGPEEIETDFMINEISLRVTSTSFIEHISTQRLRVTAISGFTILFPDTVNQEVIPAGYERVICLTQNQSLGIDNQENDHKFDSNCPEDGPNLVGRGAFGRWNFFNRLPGNILHYIIPRLSLICPSGIGSPPCSIQLPPRAAARIERLCDRGILPEPICQTFGF